MPTEHPLLNKALADISDTNRARKLKYWINTLIYKKYQEETGHYLVVKGILTRKKKQLKLVIPYRENGAGHGSAKYSLKGRLREIVLTGQEPDMAEKTLLALLYHANYIGLVFTRDERKAANKWIKKMLASQDGSSSLDTSIDEILNVR